MRILFKIFLLFLWLALAGQVWAAMSSDNYKVWLDTLSAGGGQVESTNGNFSIETDISGQTNTSSQSNNFRQNVGFVSIGGEPTVGFNVQTVLLNFGELSTKSTAYASHTFAAYTNAKEGYTVRVFGQPLNNGEYTLTPIGELSADSVPGTEQFGLNLVANTVPDIGANPQGGIGSAYTGYNVANKYAYSDGAIIAYATSYSFQTNFTVSVIVNIADDSPAGNYQTLLTYEFIPVF